MRRDPDHTMLDTGRAHVRPSRRRSASRTAAALLALIGLGLLPASDASAAPRPKVTLTFPAAGGDAGRPTPFSWTASRARPGKLVVQRQVGTGKVWRTIAQLRGTAGNGKVAALPMGSHQLRIANIGPAPRHKLWAVQLRKLRVFGRVELGSLLGAGQVSVYTWAQGTFPYVSYVTSWGTPATAFTLTSNTCRSVHVDAVIRDLAGDKAPARSATVSVLQESKDPTSATVTLAGDAPAAVDATLVPGQTWALSLTGTNHGAHGFFNGYASCY